MQNEDKSFIAGFYSKRGVSSEHAEHVEKMAGSLSKLETIPLPDDFQDRLHSRLLEAAAQKKAAKKASLKFDFLSVFTRQRFVVLAASAACVIAILSFSIFNGNIRNSGTVAVVQTPAPTAVLSQMQPSDEVTSTNGNTSPSADSMAVTENGQETTSSPDGTASATPSKSTSPVKVTKPTEAPDKPVGVSNPTSHPIDFATQPPQETPKDITYTDDGAFLTNQRTNTLFYGNVTVYQIATSDLDATANSLGKYASKSVAEGSMWVIAVKNQQQLHEIQGMLDVPVSKMSYKGTKKVTQPYETDGGIRIEVVSR